MRFITTCSDVLSNLCEYLLELLSAPFIPVFFKGSIQVHVNVSLILKVD